MQIVSVKNKRKALVEAIKILKKDGIIAHPTDTCYGFAASVFSARAIARLYKLKKMSPKKPVSILVSSISEAKKYGVWNKRAEALARKFWPGALTIVLKRKKVLPKFLNPKIKTVGLRLSAHRFSQNLVKTFGSPITTTSANITKFSPPYRVSEIFQQFKNQKTKPDLIIDGGFLDKKNRPSAVIDVSEEKVRVIRK